MSYNGPTSYNFIPPIDQYTTSTNTTNLPTGVGQTLDAYLPQYTLTTGNLEPLISSHGVTGTPLNINGTTQTGSTGGLGGAPPPATPFMMFVYSQVSNGVGTISFSPASSSNSGIVQMVLLKANTSTLDNIYSTAGITVNLEAPGSYVESYMFAPFNDIIDEDAIAKIYYNIDNTTTPETIRFYDAELIQQNSSDDINKYMLFSYVNGSYSGNSDSLALWPVTRNVTSDGESDSNLTELSFQFNEFVIQQNTNETYLKSGKFYHPLNTKLTYHNDSTKVNGYTNYGNTGDYNYFTGYGPGYPVNINYIYSIIKNNSSAIVQNGTDNRINQFNLQWPSTLSLNVYNFSYKDAIYFNGADDPSGAADPTTYILSILIDQYEDNGVLYNSAGCSDNNECYSSSNSYFANNFNTIQAGIAQYMTYQFIPFKHIKPPSTNIVTNYTVNPSYNYITLPEDITFTPSIFGPMGSTGSFPMQVVDLIDTSGNTGVANKSLISNWMQTPNDPLYQCYNAISNFSYCGFIDYYDSLYAIAYEYNLCGATGLNENPFQKGACPSNQVCVPNYLYTNNRNPYKNPLFKCVDESVGITTENMNYYIQGLPNQGSGGYSVNYPTYSAAPQVNPEPNFVNGKKKNNKEENSVFLWIAIFVAVVLILIVVFVLINSFKSKPKAYDFTNIKS
jgi:hypothetical protein